MSLQAQDAAALPPPAPTAKTAAERKSPGWFHRPEKATAEEQLEYADGLLASGRVKAALKAYYDVVCTWHESPQAPAAQFAYAKLVEGRGDAIEAFTEFQYLIDHFSGRFPFDEILDRQFRLANTVMTRPHGRFLFGGYTAPEQALPLFEQIVKNGPRWKRASEAQFYIGVINEDNEEYDDAIKAYEEVQVSYPDSAQADEASFRRAQCLYTLANDSPRNEPCYRDALSALAMFERDHPSSPRAETARKLLDELKERLANLYFERAVFYDRKARRPKAAIIAYADFIRNFPASDLATQASERIDALKRETENN